MTVDAGMVGRLAAVALVGVIVQMAAISQITVFGVPADLSALLVASVGLLAGSVTGATFGFAVGLLVDTALLQTLGLSALLLTTIGYGAGRLRELRDPAHGLTPMAVGAAAAAIYSVGFVILQFMLGADIPVNFPLLRQVLITIVLDALFALPVYALLRRILSAHLPDDPRRRRRRAYTTGGLSPLSRS